MSFFHGGRSDTNAGTRILSRRFMELRVLSITGRWHTLKAKNTDKVGTLKAQIRAVEGPEDYRGKGLMFVHDDPEWQDLIYNGQPLDDERSLQSAGVADQSELKVVRKRRAVPQAKACHKGCAFQPCSHAEEDHQKYQPDMHWANSYGWAFPGIYEDKAEDGSLMPPDEHFSREEIYKGCRGGLRAQRMRAGPVGWKPQSGAVTVQIQTEADLQAQKQKEQDDLRGSNDSLEGAIGEGEEDANNPLAKKKAAPAAASSSVEPDFADEEAESDTDSRRQTISESDAEGSATDGEVRKRRGKKSAWTKCQKWIKQYWFEVKLGGTDMVTGWGDYFSKPGRNEFLPDEPIEEGILATIDAKTELNLSYQDLGHPYQWQHFSGILYSGAMDQLRVLNLSANRLKECKELSQLDLLEVLDLSYNMLDDLDGIPSISTLKELDLTSNNLETAAGIYKFSQLERLTLIDNPIEYKEMYEDRVKARAPSSLIWLDGRPFEASGWSLQYVVKLMFQSNSEDKF